MGGNNTQLFLYFSNYKKCVKNILELKNGEGVVVRRLNEIVDLEIKKLMSIYKEPKRANIVKIVKVTSFFPRFVTK